MESDREYLVARRRRPLKFSSRDSLKSPARIIEFPEVIRDDIRLSKSWMNCLLGCGASMPWSRRIDHCWENAVLGPAV